MAPDGKGGLDLRQDGRTQKWVPEVGQVTFNGAYARERGQEVMYITDRAVFRLGEKGLRLEEVAPGIDVRADVLERIGFPVEVRSEPRRMDARLFRAEPMAMIEDFRRRAGGRRQRGERR
jgi:propionate CoA-transferase